MKQHTDVILCSGTSLWNSIVKQQCTVKEHGVSQVILTDPNEGYNKSSRNDRPERGFITNQVVLTDPNEGL